MLLRFDQYTEMLSQIKDDTQPNTEQPVNEEFVDSDINFRYNFKGLVFTVSKTAITQAAKHRPEFKKDEWKRLHRKVHWYITENQIKRGVYMFYNEEMKQGYVASVSKSGNEVRITSVLPKNVFTYEKGQHLALVETISNDLSKAGIIFNVELIGKIFV